MNIVLFILPVQMLVISSFLHVFGSHPMDGHLVAFLSLLLLVISEVGDHPVCGHSVAFLWKVSYFCIIVSLLYVHLLVFVFFDVFGGPPLCGHSLRFGDEACGLNMSADLEAKACRQEILRDVYAVASVLFGNQAW